jgi:hypothetical protein
MARLQSWELLKTCCMGEFRACGARRTLGTCPVFAKPVGTNFARSRRFREVPLRVLWQPVQSEGVQDAQDAQDARDARDAQEVQGHTRATPNARYLKQNPCSLTN